MGATTTSTVALVLIAPELIPGTMSQRGVRKSKGPAKGPAKGSPREDWLTGRGVSRVGLVEVPALASRSIHRSAWKARFCELNKIRIDSLSLFSESPAILHLFGARRLSQQSYSSFPEP